MKHRLWGWFTKKVIKKSTTFGLLWTTVFWSLRTFHFPVHFMLCLLSLIISKEGRKATFESKASPGTFPSEWRCCVEKLLHERSVEKSILEWKAQIWCQTQVLLVSTVDTDLFIIGGSKTYEVQGLGGSSWVQGHLEERRTLKTQMWPCFCFW